MLNKHFYPNHEKDSADMVYYSVLTSNSEKESVEKFYTREMRLVKSTETGINKDGGFAQKIIKTYDEAGKLISQKTINLENNKYYGVYYKNEVLLGEVIFDGIRTYENRRAGADQAVFLDRNEFESFPHTDKLFWQKNLIKNLRYPRQARDLKETGTVILAILVNKNSELTGIEVANPLAVSKSLAEEALRVASLYKGKFIAATDLKGNTIDSWLMIPIRFSLGN